MVFLEDISVSSIVLKTTQRYWEAVGSQVSKLFSNIDVKEKAKSLSALEREIEEQTEKNFNSDDPDEILRFRVWCHLRDILGLQPSLAFSKKRAEKLCEEISKIYCGHVADVIWKKEKSETSFFEQKYWTRYFRYSLPFQKVPDRDISFDTALMKMFELVAIKSINDAKVDKVDKERLSQLAYEYVESLDAEQKKNLLAAAGSESISKSNALKVLLSTGSLAGIAVTVEIAGFAAYILAAQASAFIPLVGGQTLVSTLAVLADPLLIIPVLLGGGMHFGKKANQEIHTYLCLIIITILALRGIELKKNDVQSLCESFESLPNLLRKDLIDEYRKFKKTVKAQEELDLTPKITKRLSDFLNSAWKDIKGIHAREEYPDLFGYLKEWEVLKKRKI